jgi:ATP-dependent DNA helicase RecG
MPITIEKVTDEQAKKVLLYDEGHFLDLKSKRIKPSSLSVAISAFANADGGELFIGIDEVMPDKHREWNGFVNQEEANSHLQVFESLFPLGSVFRYVFLACEGQQGLVLKVEIGKTRDIKKATDGIPYIRRGAQSLPVNTKEALKQLEYTKGLSSFETEPINSSIQVITNSTPIIEFMFAIIPTAEPEDWLRKQQLIIENRPTVAGVLLFADEPQALLPKRCGIKIYRYKTKERIGMREVLAFDPLTIEGHVYRQIRAAVETTIQIVQETGRLGEKGIEEIVYPPETLHEIITNAVLHRDYSIADDIHIRIFDNRIEIQSPGRLAAHVTPENILDERFARNGQIVRLINKFPVPPNKDVGEGLNTAFAAMINLGLKEPIIENLESGVLVTIKHEPLASPETIILEYLEDHETIKNKEAREICHVHADYVIKDIFRKLVERELIARVPGTRTASTSYMKGKRYQDWRKQ